MLTAHVSNENVWKQAFREAVLELDPSRLRPKLEAAQAAIEDSLLIWSELSIPFISRGIVGCWC
jgi:hypothetical protein